MTVIVVMGVAGSGKTTVGTRLAQARGVVYRVIVIVRQQFADK
jgi:shikimate kinase